MILAVALNAALDLTYGLEAVRWGESNRVARVHQQAGGKGFNVVRVLSVLDVAAIVIGFAGGAAGDAIRRDAALSGLAARMIPIEAESRRTVTVVDAAGATVFNEPGPRITEVEWLAFQQCYRGLLGVGCQVVVLSGSVPPGVPPDAYAVLASAAATYGAKVVLDADGAALRLGLAGRPAATKPNYDELRAFIGASGEGGLDVPAGAQALREAGADSVVVTLGRRGLFASTPDGRWSAAPPEALRGNPTGAGDAVTAGLAIGLATGRAWPETIRESVALGAAAVRASSAGAIDLDYYWKHRRSVRVEPA